MLLNSHLRCLNIGFIFKGTVPSPRETPKHYLFWERDDSSQLHDCEQAKQNVFTVLNNQQQTSE